MLQYKLTYHPCRRPGALNQSCSQDNSILGILWILLVEKDLYVIQCYFHLSKHFFLVFFLGRDFLGTLPQVSMPYHLSTQSAQPSLHTHDKYFDLKTRGCADRDWYPKCLNVLHRIEPCSYTASCTLIAT